MRLQFLCFLCLFVAFTDRPCGLGNLATTAVASEFNDNAAFWSPDNKRIAFTSDRDGNTELYVMDSNGKNERRLTNTRAIERSGVWAPDGKRIAFSSDGDGSRHVYVMNADGSNIVCLTENKTVDQGTDALLVSLIGERKVANDRPCEAGPIELRYKIS